MVVIHKKKVETEEEKTQRELMEQGQRMGLQDEYQAKGFELVSWVQHHKGLVSALIVGIFLAGGAYAAFLFYQQRAAEVASGAYFESLKAVEGLGKTSKEDQEKWRIVQQKLAEIAKNHANTQVGALANLYAGHLALEYSDEKSLQYYQDALKKINKSDDLFPMAMIGLAYAQDAKGQAAEALASFEAVVEYKNNAGKDLALWEAARLAHQLNNKEKAASLAAKLLQDFPDSVYLTNTKRLKESL